MKRLLIATDFSPASDRAVEYGLKLGQALEATVTLVAAYEEIPVPVSGPLSMTISDAADVKEYVEGELRRQRKVFQQGGAQPVETLAVKGTVAASVLEAASELHADMIVVGMKGQGKPIRRLLGDTVTALARKTSVPLLVVPEEARFAAPVNILLGNDIHPDMDVHVLDPLRELTALFRSRVFALRVVRKGEKEFVEIIHNRGPLRDLEKTWDIKYEYEMGEDVAGSLNAFARTHDIRMVVLIPHVHAVPERWFIRSHTREMIFDANIPLLILPENS